MKVFVCIVITLFLTTPIGNVCADLDVVANEERKLYCKEGNIFQDAFQFDYEVIYFIMYDGNAFIYTTREKNRIGIHVVTMLTTLKEKGYLPEDIMFIAHNHLGNSSFSMADLSALYVFRTLGFRGSYMVYIIPESRMDVELPVWKLKDNAWRQ